MTSTAAGAGLVDTGTRQVDTGTRLVDTASAEATAEQASSAHPANAEEAGDEQDWADTNQQYLVAALAEVSDALAAHLSAGDQPRIPLGDKPIGPRRTPPSALEVICEAFGLSTFERATLLLCAGTEMDSRIAAMCADAAGSAGGSSPTFSLAMAVLPEPHWSALTPDSPLRRWRLVEPTGHGPLTTAALRIDEYVLHFLAGLSGADPRLTGIVTARPPGVEPTPAQLDAAHQLSGLWQRRGALTGVLVGADPRTRWAVASHAASDAGLRLSLLDARMIPADPAGREDLARLLERESVLRSTAFVAEGAEDPTALDALVAATDAPLAVCADTAPAFTRQPFLVIDVPRASSSEQRAVWRHAARAAQPAESMLELLVAAFDLDPGSILAAAETAGDDADALWSACRSIDRPQLAAHAQRIESSASWDELVLPESARNTLRLLIAHARHRVTVYEDWGMRKGRTVGLGSTVLFSGPSGTGKTFAAEVLANELRLDLYRVDLSAVVSKYIGETEKNLRQVFDAADHGSAVLLFDEADALFGKRSEVRDSHDRYANVEVSYLLQRMEAYRGMAILTTNMAEAIDPAFLRRLRFVVNFPFPDQEMRAGLWSSAFGADTPTEALDIPALACLDLAGGTIRNVAVNAAFLAAEAGEPVRMPHLMRAARIEAVKLGRPLPSLRSEPTP